MNIQYPVTWVRVDRFCELTGYTEEAVRQKRKKGEWPDGTVTIYRNRRIFVNVRAYDAWVETGKVTSRAA